MPHLLLWARMLTSGSSLNPDALSGFLLAQSWSRCQQKIVPKLQYCSPRNRPSHRNKTSPNVTYVPPYMYARKHGVYCHEMRWDETKHARMEFVWNEERERGWLSHLTSPSRHITPITHRIHSPKEMFLRTCIACITLACGSNIYAGRLMQGGIDGEHAHSIPHMAFLSFCSGDVSLVLLQDGISGWWGRQTWREDWEVFLLFGQLSCFYACYINSERHVHCISPASFVLYLRAAFDQVKRWRGWLTVLHV